MKLKWYFTYPIPVIVIVLLPFLSTYISSFVIQPNRATVLIPSSIKNIQRLPSYQQNNYNTQSQLFDNEQPKQQQSEWKTKIRRQPTKLQMLPEGSNLFLDSISLLTSVEVFDGSSIIDPVVVSNAFWGSFQNKALSFVLGEVLASIAFVVVVTLATQQVTKLGTYVTEQIFRSKESSPRDPISLQDKYYVQPDFGKLLICIIVDSIGTSSALIPFIGDISDIVWAPIAALIVRSLYGSNNILFALEFAEEILPLTDILPLATICWIVDTFFYESNIARILQLGRYKTTYIQNTNNNDINVPTTKINNNSPLSKIIDVEIENKFNSKN